MVTARHVVENKNIKEIGFSDIELGQELLREPKHWGEKKHGDTNITEGPYFHPNPVVDAACFRVEPYPKTWIPLGGHFDDYLSQHELVLYRTLV